MKVIGPDELKVCQIKSEICLTKLKICQTKSVKFKKCPKIIEKSEMAKNLHIDQMPLGLYNTPVYI